MALCNQHIFDRVENALLAITRKLTHFFKDFSRLTNRTFASRLHLVATKEIFDGHVEKTGEFLNLIRSQRDGITFPNTIGGLGDTHLVSDLCLGQASRFAGGVQTRAERRTRFFGWSACLHGASIARRRNS